MKKTFVLLLASFFSSFLLFSNSDDTKEINELTTDEIVKTDDMLAADNPIPYSYQNSEGFLRLQTLADTQTAVVRMNNLVTNRIIVDADSYTQRDFDELMRPTHEVVYAFPQTDFTADTRPLNETLYFYKDDAPFAQAIIVIDYAKNTKTETEFLADSKPSRQILFSITESTQRKLSETTWVYDDFENVLQERILLPNGETVLEYTYNEGHKRPDIEQFDNNELVSKTLFDTEGVIKEKYEYFSNNIRVQTLYSNGKRTNQVVYSGNNVLREQYFE